VTGYIIAPEADDDIYKIWRFLYTRASLDTANRVEAELYAAFADLARTPGQGHKRSDLTSHPVLFFILYSYLIVYRARIPLEIVRVLHGNRNVKRILGESL
jgi:plasmid stabilization system protein ParE